MCGRKAQANSISTSLETTLHTRGFEYGRYTRTHFREHRYN
ncbi:hypothetical protein M3J09_000541 [Ascochyta lentis]